MNDLLPVEQKAVDFYGDELTAILLDNGSVFVSIGQMCSALGLDAQGQRRRMERHTVLSRGLGVAKLTTPGGPQPAYVLRVDLVPLWLSGIRAKSVNNESRPKLERFQSEAAAVLWEAFQDGRLTGDADLETLLAQDTEAVQAYKLLTAMANLARHQILLEARVASVEERLQGIETALQGDAVVSYYQVHQLADLVRDVALILARKEQEETAYGTVYRHFYDQFGITDYRQLLRSDFKRASDWLTRWKNDLEKSSL